MYKLKSGFFPLGRGKGLAGTLEVIHYQLENFCNSTLNLLDVPVVHNNKYKPNKINPMEYKLANSKPTW
jgi:hypothetical protein